jgi:hypothetical protein
MTVTAIEAHQTLPQTDVLDPSHLPFTGNGYTGGQTIGYNHTVTGRTPAQLDEFQRIVADQLPTYINTAARADGTIRTSVTETAYPKTAPVWHEFVGSSATASTVDTPAAQQPNVGRHRHPEDARAARTPARVRIRQIANAALQLFSFNNSTNGKEAVTYEGHASANYEGGHRNSKPEGQVYASSTHKSRRWLGRNAGRHGVIKLSPPVIEEPPVDLNALLDTDPIATISSPAPVHAETTVTTVASAHSAVIAETTPTYTEPVVAEVRAPGTDLVHVPGAKKAEALAGDPHAAFLEGLAEAGFSSLDEFKSRAYHARAAERAELHAVLTGILRTQGRAWHNAANLNGDTEAQAKFAALNGIVTGLAGEYNLRARQQSADELERQAAQAAHTTNEAVQTVAPAVNLQDRPDLARMATVIANSRRFR